jgi:hypothetical protein
MVLYEYRSKRKDRNVKDNGQVRSIVGIVGLVINSLNRLIYQILVDKLYLDFKVKIHKMKKQLVHLRFGQHK